nr:radical SAM family heme chaperone HemW [candidate division Zixibacteria bacterium]
MAISLYIHFPFCGNICGYCDFYREKYDPGLEEQFFKALIMELRLAKDTIDPDRRLIETIYIGGGTPSLIDFWHLKHLITMIREYFDLDPQLEFSMEINPESIDAEKLIALKDMGINRPVFGIQSFDSYPLTRLGRIHNLKDSYRAVYLAGANGFRNYGVDMMFGLPGQNSRRLSDDLNQLVDLAPPHISYYQLTVKPNSILERDVRDGKITLPDQDMMASMYRAIHEELKKHSYIRYEISSYAIPGFECRHNMNYWEGGDFLGLGPSAHSFIENRRFSNIPDLKKYIETISRGERPLIFDTIDPESRIAETIMLGLRTARGIGREEFRNRFGVSVDQVIDEKSLAAMLKENLIDMDNNSLRLTESGFPLADEIIRRLVK